MASVHTNAAPRGNIINGIAHGLGSLFVAVFNGLARIAESNARVKEIDRLNAMSDAQLQARGIKREDIVRHVFRDIYYV